MHTLHGYEQQCTQSNLIVFYCSFMQNRLLFQYFEYRFFVWHWRTLSAVTNAATKLTFSTIRETRFFSIFYFVGIPCMPVEPDAEQTNECTLSELMHVTFIWCDVWLEEIDHSWPERIEITSAFERRARNELQCHLWCWMNCLQMHLEHFTKNELNLSKRSQTNGMTNDKLCRERSAKKENKKNMKLRHR